MPEPPAIVPSAPPRLSRRACAAFFLLILGVHGAWQALVCRSLPGGNLTALFLIGDHNREPEELARHDFRYPHSTGYDGMLYRIIAHDPLDRKGYLAYLDNQRYRYRRILVPAVAAIAGGGGLQATDWAYVLLVDVLVAAGGVCFLLLAEPYWPPLAAAALYCLLPPVIASVDRMVLDGPMTAGFLALLLLFRRRRTAAMAAVLVLLPLVREAALAFTAGTAAACLLERRARLAAAAALTAVPALAWFWYVELRMPPGEVISHVLATPVLPYLGRMFTPQPYPLPAAQTAVMQAIDVVACACLLFSFAWFGVVLVRAWRRRQWTSEAILVAPSALLACSTGTRYILHGPYDFLRVNGYLVAWVALSLLPAHRRGAALLVAASSLGLLIYRAPVLVRLIGG